MRVFNTRQDVLDHYDARDEDHLSHRVYKTTNCGAWAKFVTQDEVVSQETQDWTVILTKGINGIHLVGASRGTTLGEVIPTDQLPKEVKEYCLLFDPGTKTELTISEFETLTSSETETVLEANPLRLVMAVKVDFVVTRPRDGLLLGSIVEGSDAEIEGRFLGFPFTAAELHHTISDIESEADFLWREANGVDEYCLDDDGE